MRTHLSVIKKWLVGITAAGILAGLLWVASPTLAVMAEADLTTPAAPAATTTAPYAAPKGALRVEMVFSAEKFVQARQDANIERSERLAVRAQALIDRLKGQGKDVAPLEQALSAFNTSLNTARGIHEQAAAIFSNHPGFDDHGKVTDLATARQTVKELHGLLVQLRQTLGPAFRDLRNALQKYR